MIYCDTEECCWNIEGKCYQKDVYMEVVGDYPVCMSFEEDDEV